MSSTSDFLKVAMSVGIITKNMHLTDVLSSDKRQKENSISSTKLMLNYVEIFYSVLYIDS